MISSVSRTESFTSDILDRWKRGTLLAATLLILTACSDKDPKTSTAALDPQDDGPTVSRTEIARPPDLPVPTAGSELELPPLTQANEAIDRAVSGGLNRIDAAGRKVESAVRQVDTKLDTMVGKTQSQVGESVENARRQVDDTVEKVTENFAPARQVEKIGNRVDQTVDKLTDALSPTKQVERVGQKVDQAVDQVLDRATGKVNDKVNGLLRKATGILGPGTTSSPGGPKPPAPKPKPSSSPVDLPPLPDNPD